MAHWNPYYSGSDQNNSMYQEQDYQSQVYNQQIYGAAPPYLGYNDYFVPSSSNYNRIPTSRQIEAEQLNQYFQTYGNNNAYVSNLTPTAAEFKPSTSSQQEPILSQTFSSSKKPEDNKPSSSKSGNFMRFTQRKTYDKPKSNDKYRNNYKRNYNRDDVQNGFEGSTGGSKYNSQRDYYGYKQGRYNKNSNGENSYGRSDRWE